MDKGRYFGFLVYPDSAPSDWWEQLKRTHGSFAKSPLHAPDDGEKKPHYHVIYQHGNSVSVDGARRCIPAGIAANGHLEIEHAPRSCQRYLIHLDDPDKQQFPEGSKAIETCNGFPLDLSRDFSRAELVEQRSKVFERIRQNGICEYADLLDGLADAGMEDLFDWSCGHTILLTHYLASIRCKWGGPRRED